MLPQYWIVDTNGDKTLCKKFIDWFNEKFNRSVSGCFRYYGDDKKSNGDRADSISSFKNSPVVLTLEQWNDIIEGKPIYSPEIY